MRLPRFLGCVLALFLERLGMLTNTQLRKNGICYSGQWEPIYFSKQSGHNNENIESRYAFELSEPYVAHLASLGVNQLWTRFAALHPRTGDGMGARGHGQQRGLPKRGGGHRGHAVCLLRWSRYRVRRRHGAPP